MQQIHWRTDIVDARRIGRVVEIVEICSDSGCGHLVDISVAIQRSLLRGSIQLPILALNQSGTWNRPGCEREIVNCLENTCRADLVHAAQALDDWTVRQRAIEIAIAGLDQIGREAFVAKNKSMQIRVHARWGQLVNIPADRKCSSHTVEIAIDALDRRVYGQRVAVRTREVMQIGNHSGGRQPENVAHGERRIPSYASSVEISIAAQRQSSATTLGPSKREDEKGALHSSRRNLVDRALAAAAGSRTTPVHIAVAALHDVAFGNAGISVKACEPVKHGRSLRLRRKRSCEDEE